MEGDFGCEGEAEEIGICAIEVSFHCKILYKPFSFEIAAFKLLWNATSLRVLLSKCQEFILSTHKTIVTIKNFIKLNSVFHLSDYGFTRKWNH